MSVQPGSRCAGRAQTQTVKGSAPVLVLVASAVLASFNCSSSVEESPAGPDPGVPVYQLVVADSFGVEMGDSLELIGSIDGFCYHPSGSVLILDRVMGRVRIVPENGNPTTFGRLGHGPGEFYSPRGICAMEDGRILVSEPGRRTVMEFDGM
ncbi:hypothetical protein JW921_02555, partial [Candidatus Fermentibacterales bacterium]|nr:hypothetical protein [Candidatus Fermentibacterales bacterium]